MSFLTLLTWQSFVSSINRLNYVLNEIFIIWRLMPNLKNISCTCQSSSGQAVYQTTLFYFFQYNKHNYSTIKKKKNIILFLWTVRLELLSPSKNKPQNKFSPPRTINKPVAKVKIQHNRVIHNFFATIRLIFQQVEAVWACCFPLSLQETAQQHCRQKKKAGNKTYLIVKVGSVEGSSKGNALLNMQNVLSIL